MPSLLGFFGYIGWRFFGAGVKPDSWEVRFLLSQHSQPVDCPAVEVGVGLLCCSLGAPSPLNFKFQISSGVSRGILNSTPEQGRLWLKAWSWVRARASVLHGACFKAYLLVPPNLTVIEGKIV